MDIKLATAAVDPLHLVSLIHAVPPGVCLSLCLPVFLAPTFELLSYITLPVSGYLMRREWWALRLSHCYQFVEVLQIVLFSLSC